MRRLSGIASPLCPAAHAISLLAAEIAVELAEQAFSAESAT